MSEITLQAPAKTNLWLRILRKREDGFHEVATRVAPLSLYDEITLKKATCKSVELTCSDPTVSADESNLAVKAVRALESRIGRRFGVRIHLEKKIPHE